VVIGVNTEHRSKLYLVLYHSTMSWLWAMPERYCYQNQAWVPCSIF
jgi:hypothetical protein